MSRRSRFAGSMAGFVALLSVLTLSCSDDRLGGTDGGAGGSAPVDADGGAVPIDEADAGGTDAGGADPGVTAPADDGGPSLGGSDGGGGTAPDAGPADETGAFRFVALGDSGEGNAAQVKVADAIFDVCTERGGCDFALLLGDNIYDTGVNDVNDEQWQAKFEIPYAALDFPFYSTLGNHDYGAPPELSFLGGVGIDPRRGDAQVDYSDVSQKFRMPDTHYRLVQGPLELVSLNTTSMFWADLGVIEATVGFDDENDRMLANLAQWEAQSIAPWRIAFGHHPYLSNGKHGNAGSYDGVIIDGLVGSGTELRNFFEAHVVGHFDVFLCGHDHSLQDLGTVNGTELLVSGGGATHTNLPGGNESLWQADRTGFLLVEGDAAHITFTFVVVPDGEDGATAPWSYAHTRTITR